MKSIIFFAFFSLTTLFSQEEQPTYEKALAQFKSSSYHDSILTLREIFKIDKPRYELHYLAAYNYWNLQEMKPALSHFQSAVKLKPEDPKAYIDIIRLYFAFQMYKPALELCNDAVKKFPDDSELKYQQVALLLKFGKLDAALEIIEKLKMTLSEDYRPLALEANIYYRRHEFDKAEISLKWASAIAPNNANLKNNLALIYEQMALENLKQKEKDKAKINLDLAKDQIDSAVNLNQNNVFLENQKRIASLSIGQ